MPKRLNPYLAKTHYPYSVREIAERFEIHPHTVRNWIKNGLKTIDDQRPVLVQGAELREFLKVRNQSNKQPCQIDQIYCLKCRKPQVPAMRMADYIPDVADKGCLKGLCPTCETVINRFMRVSQLEKIGQKLDVSIRPIENT